MANPPKIRLPIWALWHTDRRLSSILRRDHADGTVAVPIFTDQERAQRYLNKGPLPHDYVLMAINAWLELVGVLTLLEERGVTHVVFDPTGEPAGEPGEQLVYYPVRKFRASVSRAID